MKSIVAQEIAKMGGAVPFAFEVTFADGTTYRNRDEPARFALRFRNRAAEWSTAAFGHVGMIESYIEGGIDVEGDLNAAFEAGLNGGVSSGVMVNHRNRWHEFRRSNATWEQAKENARVHYGLGADFYRLWLDDPYMMYTCGYWAEGTTSLEQAQINKIEHVCRKVRLAKGESVVDIGINTRNLNFVYIILIAQTALILGRVSVEFIRSWILLHISTRINISILTDFLIKLMKLPMSFFDTKMTGDIMQRMNDQKNIQSFLTGSTLSTVFSMFNLLVFSVVLAYYNIGVFFVFAVSSALYIGWIVLFLKRRRALNYKSFEVSAKNQSSIVQLIGGMRKADRQLILGWKHCVTSAMCTSI